MMQLIVGSLVTYCVIVNALNLEYLDPSKLQTETSAEEQQIAANRVINKFLTGQHRVTVTIDRTLFEKKKDAFTLEKSRFTDLYIKASSGVAAVWGFHYYLKIYCNSQIGWQVKRIVLPHMLPDVHEEVVANDRFRSYYNSIAASTSFAFWDADRWMEHVDWMALNGINLAYAPVAQEAAWDSIYKKLGMTQEEIDLYFSGPSYLAWRRWGNVHGLMGPLSKSWLSKQIEIQKSVVEYMRQLGMVPIFPAFNGHVPRAFSRIFPQSQFFKLGAWFHYGTQENCCNLFINPNDPLFERIGTMYLNEVILYSPSNHLFEVEPFIHINIQVQSFSTFVSDTAKAIFSTMTKIDKDAVWVAMNTMMIKESRWNDKTVEGFLTSVPSGRMLVMDGEAEQVAFNEREKAFHGQPFIWCMMQSWGGTFGMYGSAKTINKHVYEARNRANSSMIGVGISSAEKDVNDVMYELLMETAWRDGPVELEAWAMDYAWRRYGCNATANAWQHLMKSVYNLPRRPLYGHSLINQRPTFTGTPSGWYHSRDIFEAFKTLVFAPDECKSNGYYHDLVDVTRQSLHYRAEQLYLQMKKAQSKHFAVFKAASYQFLSVLYDIQTILYTNGDFSISKLLDEAKNMATNPEEAYLYELNARSQVTMWVAGDYNCKQWAELYEHYYIPRWQTFIDWALDTKLNKETFVESNELYNVLKSTVETDFLTKTWNNTKEKKDVNQVADKLYRKWAFVLGLEDLEIY